MKVFVTGGGGFLGFAIVEQLLDRGYEVVSFSRSAYPALQQLGVSHRQGNLSDYPTLRAAMRSCEAVFHVAAKVDGWGRYADFYAANVIGTKHVLRACTELGIPHLVFSSSPSVVVSGPIEGADESLPYPQKYDAYYPQTKALSEQAVLAANGPQLTTCSLRPHLIWGPRDHHFLPVLFERRRKGQLRIVGSGDYLVDTIYIDNAARAHLQALEAMQREPARVGGKAYFLSQDHPISIRAFINRLLDTGGLPPVDKSLPPRVALRLGWFLENTYRIFRIQTPPRLTTFIAKHLSNPHWFDISAAKQDLGYTPQVSIEEGMDRLKDWVYANSEF